MKRAIVFGVLCASFTASAAVPFTVMGNNSAAIAAHATSKASARSFVEEVLAENKRAEPILTQYRASGLYPAVPQQGKRYFELAAKGRALFEGGPLDQCNVFGSMASEYWQFRREGNQQAAKDFGVMMRTSLRECRDQIAHPPAPTVTIRAPGELGKPPFKGCLLIMDVTTAKPSPTATHEWTCPPAAIPVR